MRTAAVGERQVEDEAVVDRVEAAHRQEREVLAVGVNTGSVSVNRSGVTSNGLPRPPSSTILRCRSGSTPGADQASHCESGEKARPCMSPLVGLLDHAEPRRPADGPAGTATTDSSPSWLAMASVLPSGEAASSSTRPSRPAGTRTAGAASMSSVLTTSIASSPVASVTQATRLCRRARTGSRRRTPELSASARTGPSRCRQQCTVPRDLDR